MQACSSSKWLLKWIRNGMIFTLVFQRLVFWFHNYTRPSSPGTGTRGMLNLSVPSKLMQPWQAYLNKFQYTKLKEKIDEAWQQYLSEVPEGQKPEKTLFEIRNKVAQRLYQAEQLRSNRRLRNIVKKRGPTRCLISPKGTGPGKGINFSKVVKVHQTYLFFGEKCNW